MKKFLCLLLCCFMILAFSGCKKQIKIAVPADVTNQARALMLLEKEGLIKLNEGIDINATVDDIKENPYNIDFVKVNAAEIVSKMKSVDFAIINSNYAIEAGINPVKDAVAIEDFSSAYANVLAVRAGDETKPHIKALTAALSSTLVADYVEHSYDGAIISNVKNPGDGYDSGVDYSLLEGKVIKVAATAIPHGEMLEIAQTILRSKNITLEIIEESEYLKINEMLVNEEVDANFFQHVPYMNDYNYNHGTKIVPSAAIHIEPMGIYGGKMKSLSDIKK